MNNLAYIQGRFCWNRTVFPGWDAVLPECAIIMPYQGWTPPMVIGGGTQYWEIHPSEDSESIGEASPYGFIQKAGDIYTLQAGKIVLEKQKSPEQAIRALLRRANKKDKFLPDALYQKPEGRLQTLLASPTSCFILLCGWKLFRRNRYELKAVPLEKNQSAGMMMECSFRLKEEYHQDQILRREDCRFPYAESYIPIRSEPFGLADYRYDSIIKVLDSTCEGNPSSVEFFKQKHLEIAEYNDLDAIFVKDGTNCYALGSRHEEFLGEFNDFQVRQLANYQEKISLDAADPLAALLEFLNKIKNNHYVITHHEREHKTEWIDEELPRLLLGIHSMGEAYMVYSKTKPCRRSQWLRHVLHT